MLLFQECEWYKIKIKIPRKTILWLKDNFYIMKETTFLKIRPIFCYLCQLLDWLSTGCSYNSVLWVIYSFKFSKVWFLIFIMCHFFSQINVCKTLLITFISKRFTHQKFSNFKTIIWESSKEPVSKSETDFTMRILKLQLSYYDNNDQIIMLLNAYWGLSTCQKNPHTKQQQQKNLFNILYIL